MHIWKSTWFIPLYRLVWPAMLQGLLVTVVFLTDRILVGQYHSDGLSVMQICGPILWSIFSLFSALDVGVLAILGRAVGSQNEKMSDQVLSTCIWLSLFIAGGLVLFAYILHFQLIPWMGRETPHLQVLAQEYFMVLVYATPFKMLGGTASAALQAGGDTKTPMWISGVAGLLNLVSSAMFIYGYGIIPSCGIIGAAYGSFLAFTLQGVLSLYCLSKRQQIPRIQYWYNISLKSEAMISVIKISVGTSIERLGYHLAFLTFSILITGLGATAMGVHQVLLAVESVGFICADAFGIAAAALVAQRLGAQDAQGASEVSWLATILGGSILSILSVVFMIFPDTLIRFVTLDPQVIQLAIPCLQVAAIAQPLMAMNSALSASLRSLGDTRTPTIVALIGPGCIRLSLSWYLGYHCQWGILGIWVASTLDWLVRVLFLVWVVRRKNWI